MNEQNVTFEFPLVKHTWTTSKGKTHERSVHEKDFWTIVKEVDWQDNGSRLLEKVHHKMEVPRWKIETVVNILIHLGALKRLRKGLYEKHPNFRATVVAIYEALDSSDEVDNELVYKYFFRTRERYADRPDLTYPIEAWVEVVREIEPLRPAVYETVSI